MKARPYKGVKWFHKTIESYTAMLMKNTIDPPGGENFNDPRVRKYSNQLTHNADLQESAQGNRTAAKHYTSYAGERSGLAYPRNYIPLPQGRQYLQAAYASMNGAGRPLYLEWCGNVEATRLQPSTFGNESQAQTWRQAEWLRQKGRRRFSNKKILEDYIAKRYATNESAQAAVSQRQFKHPSSENKFYAFLQGMTANFGSL